MARDSQSEREESAARIYEDEQNAPDEYDEYLEMERSIRNE